MSNNDYDISDTIIAKSDQLNAADLLDNPITVEITGVRVKRGEDQPVIVEISGGHKPWKPCKTTRRVLIEMWGKQADKYVGNWLTLYREPTVEWGGKRVGGIRISHASGIRGTVELSLLARKGKYEAIKVMPLRPPAKQQAEQPAKQQPPAVSLTDWCADHGLNEEAVFEWHQQKMNKPLTDVAGFIGFIAGNDKARADLREFAAEPPADDDGGYPPSMQDDEIPF